VTTDHPSMRTKPISARPLSSSTLRDPADMPVWSGNVPSPASPNRARSRSFRQGVLFPSANRASTFTCSRSRPISLTSPFAGAPHLSVWLDEQGILNSGRLCMPDHHIRQVGPFLEVSKVACAWPPRVASLSAGTRHYYGCGALFRLPS